MYLAIKYNNAASNDPCAICGARTDPEIGPELFMKDSWALVCYGCGREHDPELVECLLLYREHHFEEIEAEQLEREISGNLAPEDEEMADLREERLRRQALRDFRPGDRVRKPNGTTATVATTPMYYERAQGYPFTGWGVTIEPDEDPQISLTRTERGLGPLTELALVENLTLISRHQD